MSATAAVEARPVLEARGLTVRRGGAEVLRNVDLELRRGEVTAILGPNGAGKSTLLAALAGLLSPAAGTLECRGRLASAGQVAALARRSVRANVELALAWWGVPRGERRERAARALAALGADGLADRRATRLSGGESRRVHLARVLAVEPDVMLLDEPFAGLDPSVRSELLYAVADILRDPRRATCLVVHDRAEAWALADRVVVLLDGRVAASGAPGEVLEHPPSPEVARFLGFDGELTDGDGLLLLRPGQVALDPAGPLAAQVARRVLVEDAVRLELALPGGRVFCNAPLPGPAVGDEVRLRTTGGVRFGRGAVRG
ncbi:MAG: ATP-binding cassette domain-containing protein [Actinobacteria bacterium]|nr:ATP-binding cassette domain-containing protein [Actinomycetota bacterium]